MDTSAQTPIENQAMKKAMARQAAAQMEMMCQVFSTDESVPERLRKASTEFRDALLEFANG